MYGINYQLIVYMLVVLRVTIILHAILCILSLHHNRRPNPAICLFQSLIILCQIKLSR